MGVGGWQRAGGRESRGSGSDWGPEGTPRMVGVFRVPGEDHPEVNPARPADQTCVGPRADWA